MILSLDLIFKLALRVQPLKLSDFDLDKRGLQEHLFKNLDRLLPEDELMFVSQSVPGGEEPDIFAIDKNGKLFLFELKI